MIQRFDTLIINMDPILAKITPEEDIRLECQKRRVMYRNILSNR